MTHRGFYPVADLLSRLEFFQPLLESPFHFPVGDRDSFELQEISVAFGKFDRCPKRAHQMNSSLSSLFCLG